MRRKIKTSMIILMCVLMCIGCGKNVDLNVESDATISQEIETEVVPEMVNFYIDFEIDSLKEDYDNTFTIQVDDAEYQITNNDYYTNLSEITKGKHKVTIMESSSDAPIFEQEIDALGDTRLKVSMQYEEQWKASNCIIDNDISDSAISYENVLGESLQDALLKMSDKHFVNVSFESNNELKITDVSDWIIESQNRNEGEVLDKAAPIVFTCRKVYFPIYLDFAFDKNLLLAKYDLNFAIDDSLICTMTHGSPYSALIKLREGEHELKFSKSDDGTIKVVKKFILSSDLLLQGRLHNNPKDIELKNYRETTSITEFAGEVPDVKNMYLDDARKKLSGNGFTNIIIDASGNIQNESEWIVMDQSVPADLLYEKKDSITLTCKKLSTYYLEFYDGLSIYDANAEAVLQGHDISYAIEGSPLAVIPEEEQNLWKIIDYCGVKGKIIFNVQFIGETEMPDVVGLSLAEAREKIKESKLNNVSENNGTSGNSVDPHTMIVCTQSVEAGEKCDANATIVITCKTYADYYSELYGGKNIIEVQEMLQDSDYAAQYRIIRADEDSTDRLLALKDDEKERWIVRSVREDSKTFVFGMVYSKEVVMPELIDKPLNEAKEALTKLQIYDVKGMDGTTSVPFIGDYLVSEQSVAGKTTVDSSTQIILTVIPKPIPQIIMPKSGSKLAKDWEEAFSDGTNVYLNIDNISNVPTLKKWGKAVVTDGVAEYLDYLVECGCKVKVVSYSKTTPYKGFDHHEASFEADSGELKWTMSIDIQDEKYVEYAFYINK